MLIDYYFFQSFFSISFLLSILQSNIWDIFDIFPFLLYYHPDLCRLQNFSIEGLEITMFVLKLYFQEIVVIISSDPPFKD